MSMLAPCATISASPPFLRFDDLPPMMMDDAGEGKAAGAEAAEAALDDTCLTLPLAAATGRDALDGVYNTHITTNTNTTVKINIGVAHGGEGGSGGEGQVVVEEGNTEGALGVSLRARRPRVRAPFSSKSSSSASLSNGSEWSMSWKRGSGAVFSSGR